MDNNNTIQYQQRTEALTDEELLEQLPSLIDEESLTTEEYIFLQKFLHKYKWLNELSAKKIELEKIIKLQKQMGAPVPQINAIQSQYNEYKEQYEFVFKGISDLKNENKDTFRSLVKLGFEKYYEREWERDLKKLEERRRKRGIIV